MASGLAWSRLVFMLSMTCAVLACSDERVGERPSGANKEAAMGQIDGTVTYRERMMLPPGALVEVQLQDVSRADALATVMATVKSVPETGPPYPFMIKYDPASIDSRMRYALRATISMGEKLMFTSTEYIDPFAGPQGEPVNIVVQRVAESVHHQSLGLEGQPWMLATLGGEAAPAGTGGKPLYIEFVAQDMRVGGFSGCNRYSGSYAVDGLAEYGSPLVFSEMASTMMACADGGELERSYLQILGLVTGYRIEGHSLSLLAGPEVLATYRPQ